MALYDSRELQVFQLENAADTRSLCELRADLLLTGDYGGNLNLYQRTLNPNVEGFQPLLYSKKVSQPIVQLEWADERDFEEHCIMLCPNMISLINVLLPRNKDNNEYDVKTIFELHTKEDLYSFSWKLAERLNHLHTFAMTLTGKLLVSRGERVLYTVQVSPANMPSSLIFIESMDKIVVQGEAMTLCSYDQNQLAMTSDELGRKVAPSTDWIYSGIETILEAVTIDTKHASLIFALGTSKVAVINGADGALIRTVSKEGVRITAMNIYETRKGLVQIYSTEEQQVMIYLGRRKVWSSCVNCDVISISRSESGMLSFLTKTWTIRTMIIGSQLKIGNSKVKSENRMTREELDREIGKIERCLDDSEAPKTSHEPPKARMEMIPSPGQRSGEIQLSFQISLPGNIRSICVDVVPVDPNLGSVEIYTDNLEDEVFLEGTVQVYFGKLTLNYTPFLSPGLIATASYIHAGTEVSSTVSKLCTLPLDLICAKSSLSEVSPGFSEVTLFVEKPQHLTYLEHSQEKSFSFTSDSLCKVSLNNSTVQIIGDSVSTLVSLNSLIEQNLSPKFLKLIHISENLLNERLKETVENINTLCNKWKELNGHLEQNVKFLTSIQRTIMIKAKSTVEEKNISKLVELCRRTSNEITRHRSEIQNIEKKLERSRILFFADVQLAVLTRLVNEGADSRVICELRDIFCSSASSNDMLLQIESDLNSLSIIVGLKPSESYQGDPAKILKKTSQIISKVSTDTVQSLLKRL